MSSANERQVGGAHYQGREYQHWDWVCDIGLHYLLACASKYVSRWRQKNGVQDLEKALHYIDKAEERGIYHGGKKRKKTRRFTAQHMPIEHDIIFALTAGDYDTARDGIRELISGNAPETPTQESQG